jgi:hypothetical protein
MRLNVASTASTMDWMVKLIDVYVERGRPPAAVVFWVLFVVFLR